jgi:hypothetical protein
LVSPRHHPGWKHPSTLAAVTTVGSVHTME